MLLSPLKIAPSHGRSGPPSNTRFLGHTRVLNQMASQSLHPCLQGSLVWQTNRPTDHATWLVVLRCGLTQNTHKKLKPGLVASYDIQPGNGEGLFWFRRFINLSLTYLVRHLPTDLQQLQLISSKITDLTSYEYMALLVMILQIFKIFQILYKFRNLFSDKHFSTK